MEAPEKALAVHALEELGVDPGDLPSPLVAAGASLASFAVGALIPQAAPLPVRPGRARVRARAGGRRRGGGRRHRGPADLPAVLARALRQLLLGACAAGITYLIGILVGHVAQ